MALRSGLRGWSGAWGPGRGLGEGRRAVMRERPGTYSGRGVLMFTHHGSFGRSSGYDTGAPSCFRLLRSTGARGCRVRRAAQVEFGLRGDRAQEGEAKKVGVRGCGGADPGLSPRRPRAAGARSRQGAKAQREEGCVSLRLCAPQASRRERSGVAGAQRRAAPRGPGLGSFGVLKGRSPRRRRVLAPNAPGSASGRTLEIAKVVQKRFRAGF